MLISTDDLTAVDALTALSPAGLAGVVLDVQNQLSPMFYGTFPGAEPFIALGRLADVAASVGLETLGAAGFGLELDRMFSANSLDGGEGVTAKWRRLQRLYDIVANQAAVELPALLVLLAYRVRIDASLVP